MTQEDMVALGDYSEAILTHPSFNQLLNEFDKSTVAVMLATKPEQHEEREKQFQAVWALREFIGFMQNFIVARNEMLEPNPLDDLDDPDVHDIYRTS